MANLAADASQLPPYTAFRRSEVSASLEQIQSGKALLHETVCLVVGLIRSISPDRLRDEPTPYGI